MTGIDRSPEAIEAARAWGHAVLADIENHAWPLPGLKFDAVVVTHYLWRDLMPTLIEALAPGGVLLYETFAQGNETVGKPSRPDFLLRPGELLQVCAGMRVVAYEDGFLTGPDRYIQRIAAVRERPQHNAARYPL
jgi:SAM-dependent methyltransferase